MTLRVHKAYDETELINGCRRQEGRFQEALYKLYASKMYAVCLRYADNSHYAEDILQEGFIKVFNNISKFREEGSFEGWIRRIMVNTAIEFIRKTAVYAREMEIEKVGHYRDEFDVVDKLCADDLMKLIQSLPAGYRTVFNLYAIEGYAHKEISVMLGINEGTSKSQLARARYLLQSKLKEVQKVSYEVAI
jgi:RNA polymerase sigma-70 factor (ECF subfamily)